jgi:hypothetical protein
VNGLSIRLAWQISAKLSSPAVIGDDHGKCRRADEESPAVRARRNPCHRRARSVPDREGNYGDSPRLTAAQRQFTRTGMFAAEGIEPVVAHSRPDSARSVITKRSTARTPTSVPSWNTPPPTSSWAGTDTGRTGNLRGGNQSVQPTVRVPTANRVDINVQRSLTAQQNRPQKQALTRPFAWSSSVGRGGVEPPTFRFQGSQSSQVNGVKASYVQRTCNLSS